MKKQDLITLIEIGKLDSILWDLNAATRQRLRALQLLERKQKFRQFAKPGIRVRITKVRPRYYEGCVGKTAEAPVGNRAKPGWIWVMLDEPPRSARSRRGAQVINVPADSLEEE